MPATALGKAEFVERFLAPYADPAFAEAAEGLRKAAEAAWEAYAEDRKWPRTVKAGKGFADPTFDLPVDWLAARRAVRDAERRRRARGARSRVLLINGSSRSEHSCPGEMSKTWRLVEIARKELRRARIDVDVLDLSRQTSEYGKRIHPCKACVSTAMPLCHWPCSCYPNHALGQAPDWMNEIYPRWVAAHGVMIVTPVHWYQAPSVLKLMIDRLVCADGGNPDLTSTQGKDPVLAKKLELAGWEYPKHLAGRAFAVVVHGDAAGTEGLRRSLCDWLMDMHLVPAGRSSMLDRYVGYYEPYATSHAALDRDRGFQQEVRYAARSLAITVRDLRDGSYVPPDRRLDEPRKK